MKIQEGLAQITDQIIYILDQLEDDELNRALPIFNQSTLGQHFRHIYDFYACILKAIDRGELDYSDRDRDTNIETSKEIAIQQFQRILNTIMGLQDDHDLDVIAEFSPDIPVEERAVVRSSLGRELMYAHDHALHHLAIIKIGLKTNFPQINVDETIGVAPSTLRYRRQTANQSSSA